jgi:SPP1 gp7 family putative phage head morphogenesis protein
MATRRAPRVSSRLRRTSPRQGPRAPEHLVERMVVAAIGMVNAYTDRLMRALAPLIEDRYGQRQDAASVRPGSVADVFERVPEGELTRGFLERMFHQVDHQAADDLQRVVPVPLRELLPNAAALQDAWVARNTSLIRLEERARKEVSGILDAPIREGVRVEEITKRIEERLGVVRSRAELIARDQTLKLYGQIQEERQTEAGIVEYTWSGSLDERERPDHLLLEGTTQRWDSPPIVDTKTGRREHPGGDFQCRCAGIPILPSEDLIGPDNPANDVPANDVPAGEGEAEPAALSPEEQAFAEPIPPDAVEEERARLAEEKVAREAERETARLTEERRAAAEAARAAAERERALRVSSPREILQRFAERVQVSASVSPEVRSAVAAAAEQVGIEGLGTVKLGPDIGARNAEGLYFPGTADMKIKTEGLRALGLPLPETPGPGKLWSMGTQPGTQAEAARNTMYHELGHHAHLLHGSASFGATSAAERALAIRIDRLVEARWRAPDREYLTDYAQDPDTLPHQRAAEYFAEAFAAYHAAPAWLERVAPRAHALVQDVLRLRKAAP